MTLSHHPIPVSLIFKSYCPVILMKYSQTPMALCQHSQEVATEAKVKKSKSIGVYVQQMGAACGSERGRKNGLIKTSSQRDEIELLSIDVHPVVL